MAQEESWSIVLDVALYPLICHVRLSELIYDKNSPTYEWHWTYEYSEEKSFALGKNKSHIFDKSWYWSC